MLHFSKTSIEWLLVIEPQVFEDERGFFMETYSQKDFFNNNIDINFVQDNHSKSMKWVLRWLHFQTKNVQTKLVRVIAGSVYDVAVDLRKNSQTFWKWYGIVLSAKNKKQFLIPQWFAHWFLTLDDNTEFVYKCDNFYDKESEGGIVYHDSTLNINWEEYMNQTDILVSAKDQILPNFSDFILHNPF